MRHNEKRPSLSALCALLGYSRQAFYQFEKNNNQNCFEAELVIQQVLLHRSLQPRLGTRKLLVLMQDFVQEHQLKLGRDALFDLLRSHKLLVKKRRRRVQTTFSNHWQKKYPNLIREYVPKAPNSLWVSDITYILVGDGFAYLSLVTDAYSRKIVGFCVSETLSAMGSLKALSMALKACPDTDGLTHHSDRGVQYCCLEYVSLLKDNNIQISMTQSGDPLENAIAERVNGILKAELLSDQYPTLAVAKKGIAQAILIYNSLRPHSSCDMLTPQQAHQQRGDLRRRWKNYYKKGKMDLEVAN
ncbi:MAG: IS3 family transposase [Pedobacter sp.]|nr:MAG: IS3 family transposase [Pedobacter sp.]